MTPTGKKAVDGEQIEGDGWGCGEVSGGMMSGVLWVYCAFLVLGI
jgi:hypothetical protein